MNRGMILDTLNTMISIQIFMERKLEDRSTALPENGEARAAVNEKKVIQRTC
jgi:hypothetical protein